MEKIKLSMPVTVGERTIVELTFADPKVRHIMAVDGHDPESTAAAVALVAALTGESELLIRELWPEDWRIVHPKAQAVYSSFFVLPAKEKGEQGDPPPAAEQPKS